MFLLTLAPMTTACPGDDTSGQGASGSSGGPSPTMGAVTTPEPMPPVEGTTGGPTPPPDVDTSASTTVGVEDSSSGSGSSSGSESSSEGTTVGGELDACARFGQQAGECTSPVAEDFYTDYCEDYRMDLVQDNSVDCVAAYDEMVVCLSEVPCEEWVGDGFGGLCPELSADVDVECAVPGGSTGD